MRNKHAQYLHLDNSKRQEDSAYKRVIGHFIGDHATIKQTGQERTRQL